MRKHLIGLQLRNWMQPPGLRSTDRASGDSVSFRADIGMLGYHLQAGLALVPHPGRTPARLRGCISFATSEISEAIISPLRAMYQGNGSTGEFTN